MPYAESEVVGKVNNPATGFDEFSVYRVKTPDGWLYVVKDNQKGVSTWMVNNKDK